MAFLDATRDEADGLGKAQALQQLKKDPPGLEIARFWQRTSANLPDAARRLLSYIASSLLSRGWLPSAERLQEVAADHLDEPLAHVQRQWATLIELDLLTVEDGKITCVAGLLSTKPTGLTFHYDDRHQVHLNGPLAALAVARALQQVGEIRCVCKEDGKTPLVLQADRAGIAARNPDDLCLFLPAWTGDNLPTTAARAGGFFRDDDALGRWQDNAGDPNGMPVMSMLFSMAAVDLGEQLGAALEAVLNHLPDFD